MTYPKLVKEIHVVDYGPDDEAKRLVTNAMNAILEAEGQPPQLQMTLARLLFDYEQFEDRPWWKEAQSVLRSMEESHA